MVAGASEGIGAAFARKLAERGLSLILIARRNEPLQELAMALKEQYHVEVKTESLDLASLNAIEQAKRLASEYEVGLMVYNAAQVTISRFFRNFVEFFQTQTKVCVNHD